MNMLEILPYCRSRVTLFKLKVFAFVTLVCSLLTACQTAPVANTQSPFYLPPVGTQLVLNQSLTIPANRVKVFIQDGRIVFAPNEYRPFCRFEVLPLKAEPQIVQPDNFVIQRRGRVEDLFAAWDSRYQFAARRLWWFDDDRSPVIFGTLMFISSPAQPDVYRMMCGHLQDYGLVPRHLTVEQMQATLGNIFTFQFAR